jgi:molybdopterin molybdotransferase
VIPFADALRIVREHIKPLPTETLPLDKSLGRYLARPAKAPAHSPRFEQSAMDGYAVKMADVAGAGPGSPVNLRLLDELPAGDQRQVTLKAGHTVKVFTGSRLPRGAEAVVMKEYVTLENGRATIAWKVGEGDHFRRVGEEYRKGDVILPAGTRVTPPVVGMLVMLGKTEVAVRRLPSVTVITMGDELVAPGTKPGPGQIPDSNGPAVTAAVRALGLTRVKHRRVRDSLDVLTRAMKAGLAESDLLITVGGASVGDYDYVHDARGALKVRDIFKKVAIKPGKPNLFGLGPGRKPVFGLPGNPVSALVSYHQLVKPALLKMMGAPEREAGVVPVRLKQDTKQKKGRLGWLRGQTEMVGPDLEATLVTGQGSHMLSGLALADVLVEIPADTEEAKAGDILRAVELDWDR